MTLVEELQAYFQHLERREEFQSADLVLRTIAAIHERDELQANAFGEDAFRLYKTACEERAALAARVAELEAMLKFLHEHKCDLTEQGGAWNCCPLVEAGIEDVEYDDTPEEAIEAAMRRAGL